MPAAKPAPTPPPLRQPARARRSPSPRKPASAKTFDWTRWYLEEEDDVGQSVLHALICTLFVEVLRRWAAEKGWVSAFTEGDVFFGWVQEHAKAESAGCAGQAQAQAQVHRRMWALARGICAGPGPAPVPVPVRRHSRGPRLSRIRRRLTLRARRGTVLRGNVGAVAIGGSTGEWPLVPRSLRPRGALRVSRLRRTGTGTGTGSVSDVAVCTQGSGCCWPCASP